MPLILDSPWTIELTSRLNRLLNQKIEDNSPNASKEFVSYFQVLKKELEVPGRELLHHVRDQIHNQMCRWFDLIVFTARFFLVI
jgi:hypothetical protein